MDAEQLCSQLIAKGYKITNSRRKILNSMASEPDWMTAKSLHDKLLNQNIHIDLSTICRNLDIMYGLKMLCRVDKERNGTFAYRLQDMQNHHHHLICLSCETIVPLEYCPLEGLQEIQTRGFSNLECQFEVYGYCQACQNEGNIQRK
jgi:Fe2+ or Zn2+ uptake regulation protein